MSENTFLEKLLGGAEVKRVPLQEVAQIKAGKDWKKLKPGCIPVYGSGGIMGHVDAFRYDKPTVLIPSLGSIRNVFYVDKPFWNISTIYYTEINEKKIVPKYLYYFVKTIDLMSLNTAATVPGLSRAVLNKIEIPIPCPDNPEKSLAIQAEIVRILDKFDALTHSISEGLPREIELRQKQYEHYRALLLSLPRAEAAD